MKTSLLLCALCLTSLPGCPVAKPSDSTSSDTDPTDPTEPTPLAIVLIVDNSDSMLEEAESLAVGLRELSFPEDSLVSISTIDGEHFNASVPAIETEALLQQLLCTATCLPAALALPSDPGYLCGDPFDFLSEELLDCVCPNNAGSCGSGTEQGLATAAALTADEDLVPDGYAPRVVVLADEGDRSSDLSDGDSDIGSYGDRLADTSFSAIAPDLDAQGSVRCPGVATDWGVARYVEMVTRASGSYRHLYDDTCESVDVADALAEILESW